MVKEKMALGDCGGEGGLSSSKTMWHLYKKEDCRLGERKRTIKKTVQKVAEGSAGRFRSELLCESGKRASEQY